MLINMVPQNISCILAHTQVSIYLIFEFTLVEFKAWSKLDVCHVENTQQSSLF
jgi:hypothetical protein